MGKKELIFVYSTGRCGTAYLAQVFGQEPWRKNMLASPSKHILVLHEKISIPFRILEVIKEKDPRCKSCLDIQRNYFQTILIQGSDPSKILVTSNSIGRFCGYFIVNVHQNYKCIYIERDEEDFIDSIMRRIENFKNKYREKNFNFYIRQRFNTTTFSPLDYNSFNKLDKKEWEILSIEDKFRWHWKETKERWNDLKKDMTPNRYIETSYEKIVTEEGLDEISNFIGIPYSKKSMKVRVNQSEKY